MQKKNKEEMRKENPRSLNIEDGERMYNKDK